MNRIAVAVLAAIMFAGCDKPAPTPAQVESQAQAATTPAPDFGMDLLMLGSSVELLTASANLLAIGGGGYSAAQFATDTEKARVEAERRFATMLKASAGSVSLQAAVKGMTAAYLAFLEDVRPRQGEPVTLWQQRTSESRSSYDKAVATVRAELMAAK